MLGAVVSIAVYKMRIRRWIVEHQPASREEGSASVSAGRQYEQDMQRLNSGPKSATTSAGYSCRQSLTSARGSPFRYALHQAWARTREAERESTRLRRIFTYLAASLDALETGIVVSDDRGREITRNLAAESFVAARHGDALVADAITDLQDKALNGQADTSTVELLGNPHRTYEVKASPIKKNGKTLGSVVLVRDITEEQRINDMRRDFVANVGHELKTPVGALILLAESLSADLEPEILKSLIRRIQVESERAAETIDGLLDLAYVETNEHPLDEVVDVGDVVDESMNRVVEAADKRGVSLVSLTVEPAANAGKGDDGMVDAGKFGSEKGGTETASESIVDDYRTKPEMLVLGSRVLLVSAVLNLIDNAVKFTSPGGRVEVQARRCQNQVRILVRDNGVGMAAAEQARIFERFYCVDRSRVRDDNSGVGLGLSIVRHIVRHHGGDVTVESQEGRGSDFEISLPAHRSQ
ncbi:MAG: ATP-binding protein [Acidimicrobiaceae bacterium]|nr:ATP-binding protein [Acidimicrobiaceae bacterium]